MSAGIATCGYDRYKSSQDFQLVPVQDMQTLLARVDEIKLTGLSVDAYKASATPMGATGEVE
ncbi:hypothetical protein KYC_01664 [Achromobacter arsenitoxydans SY8]|uniref:Uncharacterized protein n=1 Tax=Achromobacter arsenitoxydans SY8 TaxID=477184 RepID=H0F0Q1_9BURK|nr:hypothetical protein KYC_01664 [Achromobacter arsenitoxydans SY8]